MATATRDARAHHVSAAFFDVSPELLIAGCRLTFALFAFAAIWPDPAHSPLEAPIANVIISAFLVYALTLALALCFFAPDMGKTIAIHFFDLAMLAALMHFFDGPAGAYFIFFALALVFAALRWSWVSLVVTTVVLVLLFLGVAAIIAETQTEFQLQAQRGTYLVVAGLIVAYLAALREYSGHRLARLARWPCESFGDAEFPSLENTLAHSLLVTGARSAAVLWEEGDEPYMNLVWLDASGLHSIRRPPTPLPLISLALADAPFMLLDARGGLVRTASDQDRFHATPIDLGLVSQLSIGTAVVAPMTTPHASGHVLLIEAKRSVRSMLPLAEILASFVAAQIEHHIVDRKLAADAAARERSQMARDLHDGTIQAMTAVAVHLQAMVLDAPDALKSRIAELQALVIEQQCALRDYLAIPRDRLPWEFSLTHQVAYTLREVEQLWGCDSAYEVTPREAKVSLAMGDQLNFLIKEAAANAVRHGGANRIEVAVTVDEETLEFVVRNNGCAPEGECHGPRSLIARVGELGGSIKSVSLPEGMAVTIALPLRASGSGRAAGVDRARASAGEPPHCESADLLRPV